MDETGKFDWDPRTAEVLANQVAAYDQMRKHCPVARSRHGYVSLFRHADILRVLLDHEGFSSTVSRFPSVPNGMDPPEHGRFRRIIEPYFAASRMQAFEPECAAIAVALVAALPGDGEVELMSEFAWEFSLQIQCAFMGWPTSLHGPLHEWIHKSHAATLSIDIDAMNAVAREFDGHVREQLARRREAGVEAPDDVTTRLLRERVDGRALTEEEIVSIVRNWTVGELGTIAASVGIIVHYLAEQPALQQRLRDEPELVSLAIDEILRMHGPLVMNRRRVKRPLTIQGRSLRADERIALNWISANRDESVFGDPDEFRLDRDPALNLLYGAGIHVCPGAPLARLELRVLVQTLLAGTTHVSPVPGKEAPRAHYPTSGFSSLPIRIRRNAGD